jgi:hypothetical protein
MMKVLGVVALLFVLIGLAFIAGIAPAEIGCEVPAQAYLQFDEDVAGPSQAAMWCDCETCLESKALANYVNDMNRSEAEEWSDTSRSAVGVNSGSHTHKSINREAHDQLRGSDIERLRCMSDLYHANRSGRFLGAPA